MGGSTIGRDAPKGNVTADPDLVAKLEAAEARNRDLEKQVQDLKTVAGGKLVIKVSPPDKTTGKSKGALSIYGLGRFPLTLYRSQIERILSAEAEIKAFISAHASELSVKGSSLDTSKVAEKQA